jgi:hypothetical protein
VNTLPGSEAPALPGRHARFRFPNGSGARTMRTMVDATPPTLLILFVAFLVAMPLVVLVSTRLRLPYTVALVVVGLGVSALPLSERLEVPPDFVLAALLPGLVFEAAYRLDGGELRRTFGGVVLLAVPGVLIVAAVVAAILNAATGLPLNECFLVGAIVSATDPVAVVSTMRRLDAPRRLVTLVDAESLLTTAPRRWRSEWRWQCWARRRRRPVARPSSSPSASSPVPRSGPRPAGSCRSCCGPRTTTWWN